ncbi:MAG: hypothetical protein JJLCMIEE_01753 [Acidimicrobiales bacterium]|nr:MAG: fatty acid desaturase [Actinomycetota bacterium]MBV6508687.1 hypothetical protein [Acidimicrobiales bacterium]RIK08125.1 MAG: fatty acid desaturase [Acidobacteriota bacterium]
MSAVTPDATRPQPTNLVPVIRAIPEGRHANPTWKGLAYLGRDLLIYGLALWGLASTDNLLLLIPLWVLSALAVAALFIVGHDAAHGALFKSRWLNSLVGHICMLPAWHVYEGWVLGHNRLHHGYTVRQGLDFVWHPLEPEQYAALSPLARLRHRLEWSRFGPGPYYAREVWWNKMMVGRPPARWASRIRRDRWIVAVFVLLSATALGLWGWLAADSALTGLWLFVKLFVVPFLLFTYVIGWVVHLHHIDPAIRWYTKKDWNKYRAQMEGTTVLHVPGWLDLFFHHIFIHVPHHVDQRIPFYELPAASNAIIAAFPGVVEERPLRLGDFGRNTKQCKLYSFDEGRWYTYAEARELLSAAAKPPASPRPAACASRAGSAPR